ncbi:Uncharacterised protein [Mycobacteroides abscessus subsp. abscessus]|nr:Uncharacterised protein [Mycobacteroides abscessus subsp. abscessus]
MRGKRFPITTVPATTTNSRATHHGCSRSARPRSAWPTKSARTPNIMKTFHSNGTPIGMELRMPKWKMSMIAAAIQVSHPPWEKNSTIGTRPSTAVEK